MNTIKYSFIIPYINRITCLKNTLNSFLENYIYRNDYEVVIVEDYKNKINTQYHNELEFLIQEFNKKIKIIYLQRPEEKIFSPAPLFNQGAENCNGEFIILTNPEVKHTMDILKETDVLFQKNHNYYIVCACFGIHPVSGECWLQHSKFQNLLLNYCSIISKENYKAVEGFDNEYAKGVAWEDHDFLRKIQHTNKITILPKDDLLVYHQPHDHVSTLCDYWNLFKINQKHFYSKWEF